VLAYLCTDGGRTQFDALSKSTAKSGQELGYLKAEPDRRIPMDQLLGHEASPNWTPRR
jgi:hypothetical protein